MAHSVRCYVLGTQGVHWNKAVSPCLVSAAHLNCALHRWKTHRRFFHFWASISNGVENRSRYTRGSGVCEEDHEELWRKYADRVTIVEKDGEDGAPAGFTLHLNKDIGSAVDGALRAFQRRSRQTELLYQSPW